MSEIKSIPTIATGGSRKILRQTGGNIQISITFAARKLKNYSILNLIK
jgi:hypothetical protein